MKSLADQLDAYAAYHGDLRNKLTHFLGVPLVTFAILLVLGWLRFVHAPDAPFTGATLFYVVVFLYYLRLDWRIALWQAPFTLALLWLADRVALWPFAESLLVFLGTFMGGWAIQLLGHVFEGKRPALADNLLQIFNAPLFLTAEVAFLFGYREDLSGLVRKQSGAAPSGSARVDGGEALLVPDNTVAVVGKPADPGNPMTHTPPSYPLQAQPRPQRTHPKPRGHGPRAAQSERWQRTSSVTTSTRR